MMAVAADIDIILLMDVVLIAITDHKKIPMDRLRELPPWRAVLMARVAEIAGAMTRAEVDDLVREAREVGGAGHLAAHAPSTPHRRKQTHL
jgi:hypothetical protein